MEPGTEPDPDLLESLQGSESLGSLSESVLIELCARFEPTPLDPGAVLFAEGDEADALFYVVSGELEAYRHNPTDAARASGDPEPSSEIVLSRVGPGSTVGEIQILTDGKRTASVRAVTQVELARLSREDAHDLGRRHPELLASLAGVIRERLRRDQLVAVLPKLFGSASEAALRAMEGALEWVSVARGERLLRTGTPGEFVYVNVSGRLRAVHEAAGEEPRILGDIEQGELVGEMALFTGRPYSASVYALRDTELARIDYESFEALVQGHPNFLRAITSLIVQRLEKQSSATRQSPSVRSIVVLPLSADVPTVEFTDRLVAALGKHESTYHLSSHILDQSLGMQGAAQLPDGNPFGIRVSAWLSNVEATHRFVVYEADLEDTAWTRRCIAHADEVLLVTHASEDPQRTDVERSIFAENELTTARKRLILIYPDGSRRPSGTRHWLEQRNVELHHHLRWDQAGDFDRIARFLANRAIGLALGGGGARGAAHVGVITALAEAHVPIDFVGGTSAGGAIAMQLAMGMDAATMRNANYAALKKYKPFREYNLPFVSLVGAKRMKRMYQQIYGETRIEDLWLNAFCVSCSLQDGETVIHRAGETWRAVRATTALPGIAVPMVDEGRLLVDGGVVDNLPGTIMKRLCGGQVILVDVSPDGDLNVEHKEIPSANRILWHWLAPHIKKLRVPSIGDVIVQTAVLSSIKRRAEAEELAMLLFRPPIHEFGMLEFTSYDRIFSAGYEHACEKLANWEERDKWILLAPPPAGEAT